MIDKYLGITSIDPIYWGKNGWIFLDSIALTYKPEYKEKYKLFFEQLPYILPCISCGQKLIDNIKTLDSALESKESLLSWLLEIRNEVYKEQGRPTKTLKFSIDEIFDKSIFNCEYYSKILFLVVVFVTLIFLYYSFIKNTE